MISVGRLSEFLKFPASQAAEVERIRLEVIELFEKLTNGLWNTRAGYVQVEEPGEEQRYLWLRLLPVVTLTSVEGKGLSDAAWTAISTSGYAVLRGKQVRSLLGSWPDLVQITYDGGYDDTTCPPEVQRALMLQAEFTYSRNREGRGALVSEGFPGGGQTTFGKADLHPFFAKVVAMRRRHA